MGLLIDNLKALAPMDAYDVQARFAPIVFALLPVLLVAVVVVPGLGQMKLAGARLPVCCSWRSPTSAPGLRAQPAARGRMLFSSRGEGCHRPRCCATAIRD